MSICLPLFDLNFSSMVNIAKVGGISFGVPHLPSPLLPDISCFTFETITNAVHMQTMAIFNLIKQLVDKLIAFLGGSLSSFFPTIPNLGVNLIELFTDSGAAIQALTNIIRNNPAITSAIGTLSSLPNTSLSIPSIDAITVLNSLMTEYLIFPIQLILDKVNEVADELELPSFSLPIPLPLPTKEDIIDLVVSATGFSSKAEMFASKIDFNFQAILMSISASIGVPLNLQSPWFSGLSMPELEFSQMFSVFMNNLCFGGYIKPIIDFVIDTLSAAIPSSFSQICF
ncbi:hypothetical protein [Alishewanella phage vB_AspM_Slickus01]|nr:hypothetical protein [Alishewanella phage vB_AspM_Slickus01]